MAVLLLLGCSTVAALVYIVLFVGRRGKNFPPGKSSWFLHASEYPLMTYNRSSNHSPHWQSSPDAIEERTLEV